MEQQETWDQLYHRKRMKQRETRGAKVKHAQLRQEIADLAIRYREDAFYTTPSFASDLTRRVEELRALEQQYPSVKEVT